MSDRLREGMVMEAVITGYEYRVTEITDDDVYVARLTQGMQGATSVVKKERVIEDIDEGRLEVK